MLERACDAVARQRAAIDPATPPETVAAWEREHTEWFRHHFYGELQNHGFLHSGVVRALQERPPKSGDLEPAG